MAYAIEIPTRVRKVLLDLPAADRARVSAAIEGLTVDPRPPGCRAMQGEARGTYRVRAGDYRVVYRVDDGRLVVLVIRVGNRREVYR